MKSYELIVERQQPPCGGKQTKLYDFRNVEIDDPVAYPEPERTNSPTVQISRRFRSAGAS